MIFCTPIYLYNFGPIEGLYLPNWWCLPFTFWNMFLWFDIIYLIEAIDYDFAKNGPSFFSNNIPTDIF